MLKILRTYLSPYAVLLVALAILQLLANISALFLPSLNADIITYGVQRGDLGYIWGTSGWMLAATLVNVACSVGAAWVGARAATSMGRDLRAAIFRRVMSFSGQELAVFGAPSLITRNTNDVQQLQQLVIMASMILVGAPVTLIGGVIMALREDVGLSWIVAVAAPLLVLLIVLIVRKMVPMFRLMQDRIDTVNRVMREQITGIRVIRAFVREDVERDRFGAANTELTDISIGVGNLMATMFPLVMLIMNASTTAVIWFGAYRVDQDNMEIGSLFAYMSYLIQILMSVMMATMVATMAPRAAVSADRISEVLDTASTVVAPTDPVPLIGVDGRLELDQVSFTYPGAAEPVLNDISLAARPGTVTAIIGGTGSGKSTLLNLIPRLYDATSGSVLVDGHDVRELDPHTLWERVAIVPQKPYLFSGTVASNLRFGDPGASDEELWAALDIAQARDFVEAMPEGLDAPIAQGGTNVSGGQRQRLCIARALVARPEIYLFDDSFSALDLETDARLRAALAPTVANATVIIVAQRVSTIIDADQIVVLEAGRVVGLGRHDELVETCPTYQEVVSSQLSTAGAA